MNLIRELVAHSCSEKALSSHWQKFIDTSALVSTYGIVEVLRQCHIPDIYSKNFKELPGNYNCNKNLKYISLFKYQSSPNRPSNK